MKTFVFPIMVDIANQLNPMQNLRFRKSSFLTELRTMRNAFRKSSFLTELRTMRNAFRKSSFLTELRTMRNAFRKSSFLTELRISAVFNCSANTKSFALEPSLLTKLQAPRILTMNPQEQSS